MSQGVLLGSPRQGNQPYCDDASRTDQFKTCIPPGRIDYHPDYNVSRNRTADTKTVLVALRRIEATITRQPGMPVVDDRFSGAPV